MKSLQLLPTLAFVFGWWGVSSFVTGEQANFPLNSRLCGNHTDGIYRVHNQTQRCYKVGEKGPCGEMMIFYADPEHSEQGHCDCDFSFRCNRPMVYWPALDRCYFVYDQGPCATNSWITFGWNLEPTCARNPCASNLTEFDEVPGEFWFFYQNQCILTGTQGLCPFSNEKSIFNGFSHHVGPYCSPITFECKLPEIPSLICVPGQKWHQQDGCGLWDSNPKPRHRHPHRYSPRQSDHHHRHEHGHHDHHHKHGFQHNHDFHFHSTSTVSPIPRKRPSLPPQLPQPYPFPSSTTATATITPSVQTIPSLPPLPSVSPTRSTNQRPLPQVSSPAFSGDYAHAFHNNRRLGSFGFASANDVVHAHDN